MALFIQYVHCKSERSVLALKIGPFRWVKYRANTVQLSSADLVPGLKWALPWAGIAFWLSFFGLNCAQMAPGRAESDFGLQGWIDTLELKQIFLIFILVPSFMSLYTVFSGYRAASPFGSDLKILKTDWFWKQFASAHCFWISTQEPPARNFTKKEMQC